MAAPVTAVLISVVGAAASRILADELKAWRPRLTGWLVDSSVRRLPEQLRERYYEEWLSHIEETPGDVGKLFAAVGLLKAGTNLRSMWRKQAKITAIADKQKRLNEAITRAGLQQTPEDAWQSMGGAEGLWAIYRNSRAMIDMVDDAAIKHGGVDRLLREAINADAMQIRVCALMALVQYRFGRNGEGYPINAFRAAQIYKALADKMRRLSDSGQI